MRRIFTFDGLVASGTSSAAKRLAEHFDGIRIDSGAIYRTLAFAARGVNLDIKKSSEIVLFAETANICVEFDGKEQIMLLGNKEVNHLIRSQDLSSFVPTISSLKPFRDRADLIQVEIANSVSCDVVADGRDTGYKVFPNADYKFWLRANQLIRAWRRYGQYVKSGEKIPYFEVLKRNRERDEADIKREFGVARKANDAIVINNTLYSSADQTVEKALTYIK